MEALRKPGRTYVWVKVKPIVHITSISVAAISAITLYLALGLTYEFRLNAALALAVSLIPIAVFQTVDSRLCTEIDENLEKFLIDLADAQLSGISMIRALEEAAGRSYGALTGDIRYMVARIQWGFTVEDSLQIFKARAITPLSRKIAALVAEAVRYGGDLRTVFTGTAEFVRRINDLRRERWRRLRPYVIVFYISIILLLAITAILFKGFIEVIAVGGTTLQILPAVDKLWLKTAMLDLAIIESIFGGLSIGKVSEGAVKAGVKHTIALMAAVYVTFRYLL
ncbi:MAG: type II secretion system F family protein [Candidatus Bathyarchaeota archaeon]|nr:type II secretion system F family protein [Candidatus Bathyarchaeota archaeon]